MKNNLKNDITNCFKPITEYQKVPCCINCSHYNYNLEKQYVCELFGIIEPTEPTLKQEDS